MGNSAPYGHRGDLTTISEAILAHGGEARAEREAFVALAQNEPAALVKFLKTLQVLPAECTDLVVNADDPCITGIPRGANVTSFTATAQKNDILITWETASEQDVVGFNLWRGISPDTLDQQLNSSLILSQSPANGEGASYQWEDTSLAEGITYYYQLQSVTSHSISNATAGEPTAIAVATVATLNSGMTWESGLLALLFPIIAFLWKVRTRQK